MAKCLAKNEEKILPGDQNVNQLSCRIGIIATID